MSTPTEPADVMRLALRNYDSFRDLARFHGIDTVSAHGLTVSVWDLERVIGGLSLRKRQALMLVVVQDRPVREVGEIMGIRTATCVQYTNAALRELAAAYFAEETNV